MNDKPSSFLRWRFYFILIVFFLVTGVLIGRLVYLTVLDHPFLLKQGNARSLRVIQTPAYRGMILDRRGDSLAISTPVDSVWINPKDFPDTRDNVLPLTKALGISVAQVRDLLKRYSTKEFAYLKRGVTPDVAKKIQELAIPGVYLQRGYRRYYPTGAVASQELGFTNVDDQGQEGLELAYDNWLAGEPGEQRVLKDRYGQVVANIAELSPGKPGRDLTVSLDNRIQYLAYSVLASTVREYGAESGSIVVLNPKTGEILAMTNYPSFNSNQRVTKKNKSMRNAAETDMFEPGSTMKTFSIASALDSGKYTAHSIIHTAPGYLKVEKNIVRDEENNGDITVTQVLQKSSNVGVTQMTLSLPPEHFVDLLRRVGFGDQTQDGFPGESPGKLSDSKEWRPFELATLAFGYGISITPIQLAQAYEIVANDGLHCPLTFLKRDTVVTCSRAMDEKAARSMLAMLETVVTNDGTGFKARLKDYRVAGKTGTAYVAGQHGYNWRNVNSSFVGIAPVSDPQLVVAVVIRKPHKSHYGADVAAPAFSAVMSGALHFLNVPSDKLMNGQVSV
ncbi:MAG: penicillin-binding protein 2 [Pseudomonadota bacterium]